MEIQTFTNSSLVSHTKISPNKTVNRMHVIDTISIHCVVGQASVEALGNHFALTSTGASSNYGIGYDGKIGMYVEEKDRSWCTSNAANDHRAITIEVASDASDPYAVRPQAYEALIELLVDICKRNNIKGLRWRADKSLIGQVDKQNMTVHRWFSTKTCPGEYLYSRHGEIARLVNEKLGVEIDNNVIEVAPDTNVAISTALSYGSQGSNVKALQEKLNKLGYTCGIVDGVFGNQTLSAVKKFQKDASIVVDGVAGSQTLGAIESALSKLDQQQQQQTAIVNGSKLSLNNISLYVSAYSASPAKNISGTYYVWSKTPVSNRIRITNSLENVGVANKITGWINTKDISVENQSQESTSTFKPYIVATTVANLNIRKGPGTNYATNGTIKNKGGAYTIVEESSGQGAIKWLKLKSGAGWIASNYTVKI